MIKAPEAFTVECETIEENWANGEEQDEEEIEEGQEEGNESQEEGGEEIQEEGEEEENQEEGGDEGFPRFQNHTAQIYQDRLYVYGGLDKPTIFTEAVDELWCFDLKNLTWEQCEPEGEGPGPRRKASSFIYKDQLYIYGGDDGFPFDLSKDQDNFDEIWNDIFVLDFASMSWKRIQQKEKYLVGRTWEQETDLYGAMYKDNLLIIGEKRSHDLDTLCSWNINTNSWSTFKLRDDGGYFKMKSNLIVYKNLLLVPSMPDGHLSLVTLNLDQINFPATSESPEQQLFMNEAGSDVALKVQGKVIPAHRDILTKRSRYFANLFNSGMAESRQDVIEINDCEFDFFKEFVRFLYFGKEDFKIQDEDLAVKLLAFADKYVQDDLQEKCIDFFQYTLTTPNVYKRLDFARRENLPTVEKWCLVYLRNTVDLPKLYELVEYLNKEENPEFIQRNLPLENYARDLIFQQFIKINQKHKDNLGLYEGFLVKTLNINTFVKLAMFIYGEKFMTNSKSRYETWKQWTANLRSAIFAFIRENSKQLEEKNHLKGLPEEFYEDYESDKKDEESKKDLKRMEPSAQNDGQEESPTLKKTKQE